MWGVCAASLETCGSSEEVLRKGLESKTPPGQTSLAEGRGFSGALGSWFTQRGKNLGHSCQEGSYKSLFLLNSCLPSSEKKGIQL